MQLPVDYEALLAKQREEMAARLAAPAGDYIKIGTDKSFTFPNGDTTSQPFEGIVLDFQYYNVMYEGSFVRGQPNRAICFANGAIDRTMAPSDAAPEKQADACGVCPMNQFGSAGAGKACKNRILVALLPPDATEDTEPNVLSIPPTALKHFQKYMRTLTKVAKMNSIEVVTRVGFNPNSQYAEPMFDIATDVVDGRKQYRRNPILALSIAKKEGARDRLESEEPNTQEQLPAAGKGVKRR
jgi:hypothetical protein